MRLGPRYGDPYPPDKKNERRVAAKRLTREQEAEVIKLANLHVSYETIAKRTGVSRNSMSNLFRRLGIQPYGRRRPRKDPITPRSEQVARREAVFKTAQRLSERYADLCL